MNGSRPNHPSHGGKTSFDQLSRTIEGLEARIQGLANERRAPSAAQATPVNEILERQRILSSARDRVAAADRSLRNSSSYEPRREPPRPDMEPMRIQPPQNEALKDIAATLDALRSELRQGLSNNNLDDVRSEIVGLKKMTASGGGSSDMARQELQRLNDSIRRLSDGNTSKGVDSLMAEIADLRSIASGLAREDSLRHLDERWTDAEQIWDRTERKIDGLDQDALRREIVQMAWRIDGIKDGLGEINAAPALQALEDKLMVLADAVEAIGRSVESRVDLSPQIESLDLRLDEISRAIAANSRHASSNQDPYAFQKIEQRIADLASHIDAMHQQSNEAAIAERIEALTQRIEELAADEETQKLEARINQLSGLIEESLLGNRSTDYSNHFADISRRIDGIGDNGSTALIDRLDALTQRLDDFERPMAAAPVSMAEIPGFHALESRLADIAARLDETVAAPAVDTHSLYNLEQQIASLSSLLTQSSNQQNHAEGGDLNRSISIIEDYIASSDEFIVEAARQAAEAVVEAYSRSGVNGQYANSADLGAMTALAEDLRALENYARSSEERTVETFSALHQTLTQIAHRLDELGEAAPRAIVREEPVQQQARAVEPVAAPRMPAAPQLQELAQAQSPVMARMDDAPRAAPRESKVDILQDEALLPRDIVSEVEPEIAIAADLPVKAGKPASKSLIAGLAAKLKPAKKAEPARMAFDPTPALDTGDLMVSEDGNLLMEPGSGVPDVKKIMEKVRAGQKSAPVAARGADASQADIIAAARRAAQAAAREAGVQQSAQIAKAGLISGVLRQGKVAKSAEASQTRRPLLLAAGAVLLVLMSYPVVANLIKGHAEAPEASTTETVAPAASQSDAAKPAPAPQTMGDATIGAQPLSGANLASAAIDPAPQTSLSPSAKAPMLDQPSTSMATPLSPAGLSDPAASKMQMAPAANDQTSSVSSAAPDMHGVTAPADLKPASLATAAKKGDPLAFFEIASRYSDGRGLTQDPASAAKWYQLAADAGLAPAQYRLASMYEKGTGIARDIQKAKTLYVQAADQGNTSAMHNLAVLNATGTAGKPDFQEAAHWFKAAAEHNVRDSQYNLAILYARGNGVQQDLAESYKWFAAAARQGDQDAAQKRDEVANAMSSDQLKAAKAKLDLWKPQAISDDANFTVVPDEWLAKEKSNTTASIDMKRAIRNIQAILNNNGFDAGAPDGEMGNKTVDAIKSFQKKVGQPVTGKIDEALVQELLKRNKHS